jgi:hypothetical protein
MAPDRSWSFLLEAMCVSGASAAGPRTPCCSHESLPRGNVSPWGHPPPLRRGGTLGLHQGRWLWNKPLFSSHSDQVRTINCSIQLSSDLDRVTCHPKSRFPCFSLSLPNLFRFICGPFFFFPELLVHYDILLRGNGLGLRKVLPPDFLMSQFTRKSNLGLGGSKRRY